MNGNSSKQVLLSVLGIAILVVAVVGVSFAFFSYTKTGSQNNTIATGQIYTYLQSGANMVLTDAMPVPAANEPTSIISSANSDIGKFSFSVVGENDSDSTLTYKVYLVPGTNSTGKAEANKIANNDIGIFVDAGNNSAVTLESNVDQQHTYVTDDIGTTGMLIATGVFAAGTTTAQTHSYDVNLWVRGATVTISDTDDNAKYCAHAGNAGGNVVENTVDGHGCEHDATVYSDAWYAAKIKVVAGSPTYDYTVPTP